MIKIDAEQVRDEDEAHTMLEDEAGGPDRVWPDDPDYDGYICDMATGNHGHDVGVKALRDGTLMHVSNTG